MIPGRYYAFSSIFAIGTIASASSLMHFYCDCDGECSEKRKLKIYALILYVIGFSTLTYSLFAYINRKKICEAFLDPNTIKILFVLIGTLAILLQIVILERIVKLQCSKIYPSVIIGTLSGIFIITIAFVMDIQNLRLKVIEKLRNKRQELENHYLHGGKYDPTMQLD